MPRRKYYECFKCGITIETDDPEGVVYEIPTQSKKKYYLCSVCHDEGGYDWDLDPCFETEKDVQELFEEFP
jgi:hypothetical protein